MKEGDVRADVFIPSIGKKITMRTNVKTDSGQSWKVKLEQVGYRFFALSLSLCLSISTSPSLPPHTHLVR